MLSYRTGTSDRAVAEGFLQRCAFDDTVSLEQMEAHRGARRLPGRLPDARTAPTSSSHEAHLITWEQP